MATATKTWAFASTAEGWTAVPAGSMAMAWETSDGSPASGCLQNRLAGKNQNPGLCYWYISGTWESIFGISAGSTVTEVGTSPNAD
ncbi:MAG TPA: hypothetical protein VMW24_03730, partial [Sedimentisphaerales bacterium]|nr:hypothetical protein [Sedimentisphaerales bacterium]